MKAFECLQQEHDLRRRQIIGDIRLIEAELCRLTQAEQERKATQAAASTTDFSERRKDLVRLLAELRKQKKLRESELHKRLVSVILLFKLYTPFMPQLAILHCLQWGVSQMISIVGVNK